MSKIKSKKAMLKILKTLDALAVQLDDLALAANEAAEAATGKRVAEMFDFAEEMDRAHELVAFSLRDDIVDAFNR